MEFNIIVSKWIRNHVRNQYHANIDFNDVISEYFSLILRKRSYILMHIIYRVSQNYVRIFQPRVIGVDANKKL